MQKLADVLVRPGGVVSKAEVQDGVVPGGLAHDPAFDLADPARQAIGDDGLLPRRNVPIGDRCDVYSRDKQARHERDRQGNRADSRPKSKIS